ncbi:SIR2 family protein [Mesorhizobium sp. M1378]|uniref:P-loop NTPase n=1 Tax=Mesorhizobium sp. M1378 TaxID=2957092 RepID=UPI00333D726E
MIKLPPTLISAVREQRAVLFLGAGASIGAMPTTMRVPRGDDLRDKLSDKYLGGGLKTKSLSSVAAMAANEAGLIPMQKYVREIFEPFAPAVFQKLLPQFRWHTIATTNYDLIIERAYRSDPRRLQNLVVSYKDGDLFDVRVRETTSPVGYYKLHGCIDHYMDESIPMILGQEQYASYLVNRGRFYGRLRDAARDNHVIFIGYQLSDPHIQQILFDLTDQKISRPMYYLVTPTIDDIEARYWSHNQVTCIPATFEQFLTALDAAIPTIARALPKAMGGGSLSIRVHYKIHQASESVELQEYIENDVTHIHPGLVPPRQDPKEFYKGYDNGWGGIAQNLDVRRSVCDSVLVDAILDTGSDGQARAELFIIKGPAGNGKSVVLKRIAWDAAFFYDKLVLFASSSGSLRIDALEEINRLTGKRIYLFIDKVALVRNELSRLLEQCRQRSIDIAIIGTERDNEWNIYCEDLEKYVRQEFAVHYMTEKAVSGLLELLERHKALGILEDRPPEQRKLAFIDRAGRQILVALHEATLGLPFEKIVYNEYEGVEPAEARNIYLHICALHQYGVTIRAGLISRSAGISFIEFGKKFIKPLENVVIVQQDGHNRDVFYESRHQHVAELVFNQALKSDEEKFDVLTQLAQSINTDYSTDKEAFSRMVRGRSVSNTFAEAGLGRLFYDKLNEISPDDPYIFHQRAVYELQHRGGELAHAEIAAAKAHELAPNSRSIKNTQADIARRRAAEASDPLKKAAFRKAAWAKLGGAVGKASNTYDLNTRAKLAIDELRDMIDADGGADRGVRPEFLEALKAAEQTIQRGLQQFPDSTELLATEAGLAELLDRTSKATQMLRKAFDLNPRQDWLAARVARLYQKAGDPASAEQVLNRCLQDNPGSKTAHLALAHLMRKKGGNPNIVLEHYKRSFTASDNNHEGQFWYARELFVQGRVSEAEAMFTSVHERAPGRFRNGSDAPIFEGGVKKRFRGKIERAEAGYAFVRFPDFKNALFASKSDHDVDSWPKVARGAEMTGFVTFNRRGPRVIGLSGDELITRPER